MARPARPLVVLAAAVAVVCGAALAAAPTAAAWSLLRPGGFLLTALTATSPGAGQVSHRSTVITAARAAGLIWQQEYLVLLEPLPEDEPRATPDTAADTRPALLDGRHRLVHRKALAFRAAPGGSDA